MQKVILPEMIDYFRKQKGWTMKDLGTKMNKTESAISKWISGDRSPMVEDLDKLVNLFDTDIKTLTYGGSNNHSSTSEKIINIVKQLNVPRQNITLGFVTAQLEEQHEESKIINIDDVEYMDDIATGLVSAGTGVWQDDYISIKVQFPKNEAPDEYDTIAKVIGQSMEPLIHDGALLFIENISQVDFNKIGIFQVNGENFVKKLRKGENGYPYLESINNDFDDIELCEDDEIRTIGEVVGIYNEK